jgi:hypothetical protein
LINIGQAHRLLNQLGNARAQFARFLAEAPEDHPQRESVDRLVADIDRVAASRSLPIIVPSAAPPAATPALATSASRPVPRRPISRHPGLWIGLIAGVAVVAGVGFGVGFGLHRYPTGSLDPIAASQP